MFCNLFSRASRVPGTNGTERNCSAAPGTELLRRTPPPPQVKVKVLAGGVGEVTRNDVAVASVADAKVIAFSVGANFQATEDARVALGGKPVEIGYYSIVYEVGRETHTRVGGASERACGPRGWGGMSVGVSRGPTRRAVAALEDRRE